MLFSALILATQAVPGSSQSFDQVAFGSNPKLKKHFHFYNLMVLTCLDCFFQFLEEMWDAMFVCRKRICYHVSVRWIMVTQPFILHSHKKTILVVKIIVIFQNSTHNYLQTTSKDAKSVMLSYFCLLQVISLLYTIL